MTCENYAPSIEAYVDGECPEELAADLREHFRVCSSCRNRAERLSGLQELAHRALSRETAPPSLWEKVSRGLDQAEAVSSAAPRRPAWHGLRPLLAVAAAVLVLAAGTLALLPGVPAERAVVHETIEDFVTFQVSGRPFDNLATDPAAVRGWFADKIHFKLPAMKSRAAGFELVGSRLCWLLDRRLGAFSYQRGGRSLTLYVMDGDGVELSGGRLDPVLGAVAARHRVGDYKSLVWQRGGLIFSLVSDASDQDMTAFAAAVLDDSEELAARERPWPGTGA